MRRSSRRTDPEKKESLINDIKDLTYNEQLEILEQTCRELKIIKFTRDFKFYDQLSLSVYNYISMKKFYRVIKEDEISLYRSRLIYCIAVKFGDEINSIHELHRKTQNFIKDPDDSLGKRIIQTFHNKNILIFRSALAHHDYPVPKSIMVTNSDMWSMYVLFYKEHDAQQYGIFLQNWTWILENHNFCITERYKTYVYPVIYIGQKLTPIDKLDEQVENLFDLTDPKLILKMDAKNARVKIKPVFHDDPSSVALSEILLWNPEDLLAKFM